MGTEGMRMGQGSWMEVGGVWRMGLGGGGWEWEVCGWERGVCGWGWGLCGWGWGWGWDADAKGVDSADQFDGPHDIF